MIEIAEIYENVRRGTQEKDVSPPAVFTGALPKLAPSLGNDDDVVAFQEFERSLLWSCCIYLSSFVLNEL